jgi:hypothetical protein
MLRIYKILPSPEDVFKDVVKFCCWKTVSSPIRFEIRRSTLGRRKLAFVQAGLI